MALMQGDEDNDVPNPMDYKEYLVSREGYDKLSLQTKFALLNRVKDYERASRDQLLEILIALDNHHEYTKVTYQLLASKSFTEFSNDPSVLPDSIG